VVPLAMPGRPGWRCGSRPHARRARVQASKCWSQALDRILGTGSFRQRALRSGERTDILWASCQLYPVVIQSRCVVGFFDIDVLDDDDPFDIDVLDDDDPFDIDDQVAHLFKHAALGLDDVYEVWQSNPLFYPAKPPAHWLMVSEVGGRVLVVVSARSPA
jgi:hypothetical protein